MLFRAVEFPLRERKRHGSNLTILTNDRWCEARRRRFEMSTRRPGVSCSFRQMEWLEIRKLAWLSDRLKCIFVCRQGMQWRFWHSSLPKPRSLVLIDRVSTAAARPAFGLNFNLTPSRSPFLSPRSHAYRFLMSLLCSCRCCDQWSLHSGAHVSILVALCY